MSQTSFLDKLTRQRRPLSVSELTTRLKVIIENQFRDLWVEGEVSNFRRHSSGHWYFSLKDAGATVRCASYRMSNRLIRFVPEDGTHVLARGRLSIYEPRGEYQLVVEHLEPVGVGALQIAFEQLKARLAGEGLFDEARKRPLPLLPRCIGIVTSPTGAAIRDILRTLKRRNEAIDVLLAETRVQGEGAASEIARAIRLLNSRSEVDVIIVARGGGSIEDLWSFNDEAVARAIFKSRVPVISAVGHETDFTIADFVADMRASTPSVAAEMVAGARGEMSGRITTLVEAMQSSIRYQLLHRRGEVSRLVNSRALTEIPGRVSNLGQRCDRATASLEAVIRSGLGSRRAAFDSLATGLHVAELRRRVAERRAGFEGLVFGMTAGVRARLGLAAESVRICAGKLDSLSPLAVLSRGYAIAFDSSGRVIKRESDVATGDRVRVRVSEGEMDCTRT